MALRLRADDGPLLVVIGSTLSAYQKKRLLELDPPPPPDRQKIWIRA